MWFSVWNTCSLAAEANEVASGLSRRLIVGYQGWFGCPGDAPGNIRWEHWFHKNNSGVENLAVDLLPSVARFHAEDLCPTQLHRADGSQISVFSSQNPRVVATHFQWMRDHAIDGAAVQRFVGPLATPELKQRSDKVLRNVRAAAEASGRVFYVTYPADWNTSASAQPAGCPEAAMPAAPLLAQRTATTTPFPSVLVTKVSS